MVRRLLVALVLLTLVGLCIPLGLPRSVQPNLPGPDIVVADAAIPIVAIRGQPLAEHEDPLPLGARVRFGSTRFRHPVEINEHWPVIDGRYLLSVSRGELTLTNTFTGRRVVTQPLSVDHRSGWALFDIIHVAVSPDGGRFVVWDSFASAPNSIFARVWEIDAEAEPMIRPVASIRLPDSPTPSYIERVKFSMDSRELILSGWKGLLVYETGTGHLIRQIESETEVLDVATAGRRFVTASVDYYPKLLCFNGIVRLPTYRFRARSADSPTLPEFDGLHHAPGPPNRPVDLIVRDTVSGDWVATIPMPGSGRHYAERAAISPDGKYVSVTCLGDVFVWDVSSGKEVLRVAPARVEPGDPPDQLDSSFTPDSRRLIVSGNRDRKRERRFDLRTGREVTREQISAQGRWPWSKWERAIVDVDDAGVIRRRDAVTGQPLVVPSGYGRLVMDCSQNGRLIAVGDATGRLDIWSSDGRLVRTLQTGGDSVVAIAFNPDGTRLAACNRTRLIRIWSVEDGREYHRVAVPAERNDLYPDRLTFAPDGQRLLLSRGDVMALWKPGSPDWLWDQHGSWTEARADRRPVFTPDGQFVVTACPGCARSTWLDAATGATKRELEHPGPTTDSSGVSALAVSPDGRTVATMHSGRALRLQDAGTGSLVRQFALPPDADDSLGVVRFSPDGRRIVACGIRGRAHVWEVATGQLAFTLTYPDGEIADVFFGPDGRSLITSNHREVIVWELLPDAGVSADLWADLGHDAARAEQARRVLLGDPVRALELLRAKLRPVEALNDSDLRRLIRSLDADNYRARERAVAGLLAAGRRVLPMLKETRLTSDEASARLAAVVRDLAAGLTAAELRQVRSIEVLEQIGSPDARDLIDKLTTGDPSAILTEEAKKCCRTTNNRSHGNPLPSPDHSSVTTARPVTSPSPAGPPYATSTGPTTVSGGPTR